MVRSIAGFMVRVTIKLSCWHREVALLPPDSGWCVMFRHEPTAVFQRGGGGRGDASDNASQSPTDGKRVSRACSPRDAWQRQSAGGDSAALRRYCALLRR